LVPIQNDRFKVAGLLIPGLSAQGLVQEHLDVGFDALWRGQGARRPYDRVMGEE
jgi:hypothetical protein